MLALDISLSPSEQTIINAVKASLAAWAKVQGAADASLTYVGNKLTVNTGSGGATAQYAQQIPVIQGRAYSLSFQAFHPATQSEMQVGYAAADVALYNSNAYVDYPHLPQPQIIVPTQSPIFISIGTNGAATAGLIADYANISLTYSI